MTQDEFTPQEIKEFKIYTEKQMMDDLLEMVEEKKKINERSLDLKPIHEDVVLVERLDYGEIFSSTILASGHVTTFDKTTNQIRHVNTREARLKDSWLVRVIGISDTVSAHDVVENKKKAISIGDIAYINSESAYALNVRDAFKFLKDIDVYGRIWTVSINNILYVDKKFDFYKVKEELIRDRHVKSLEYARIARQEKAERSDLGKSRLV